MCFKKTNGDSSHLHNLTDVGPPNSLNYLFNKKNFKKKPHTNDRLLLEQVIWFCPFSYRPFCIMYSLNTKPVSF